MGNPCLFSIPAHEYLSDFHPVSPQVFQAVGAGQNALLLSGFFGVCKVVSCAFFLIFLVERIGRRWSLLSGSFLMGTYMFIIAVLTQRYPPVSGGTLTPPAIASLTMVFLEASECPSGLFVQY
jgi:hypothetical protein